MSRIDKIVEEEKEALRETELCKNATNFVPYRGSKDPRFVFVGEAPGKAEDREGRPFVGRAGRLLDEWIDGLGLDEEDYAITNVVKCRPPDNRTPTTSEEETFGPWLEKELDAFDPEVILPLGTTATEFLLPAAKNRPFLDEVCYTRFDSEFGMIVPLPHPAYGLRQGGMELPYGELNEIIGGA